ncbi:Ig-like domain-containing protein [Salipiger sp. H15]|uniref:Ig-like domain-containing protein n=1 Tax=Alloyangia sp. H15 TaxID=3029062 RepID=A0AAU8ADG0_9RHOB
MQLNSAEIIDIYRKSLSRGENGVGWDAQLYADAATGDAQTAANSIVASALLLATDFTAQGDLGISAGSLTQIVQTLRANAAQISVFENLTDTQLAANADDFARVMVAEFDRLAVENPASFGHLAGFDAEVWTARYQELFTQYKADMGDYKALFTGAATEAEAVRAGIGIASTAISAIGFFAPPPASIALSVANAGLTIAGAIYAAQDPNVSDEAIALLVGRAAMSVISFGMTDFMIDTMFPAVNILFAEAQRTADPFDWSTLGISNLIDLFTTDDSERWDDRYAVFQQQMPDVVASVQASMNRIASSVVSNFVHPGNSAVFVEMDMTLFPDLSFDQQTKRLGFVMDDQVGIFGLSVSTAPIVGWRAPTNGQQLDDFRPYLTFTSPQWHDLGTSEMADTLRTQGGTYLMLTDGVEDWLNKQDLYKSGQGIHPTIIGGGDTSDTIVTTATRHVRAEGGDDYVAITQLVDAAYYDSASHDRGTPLVFDGGSGHDVLDLSGVTPYTETGTAYNGLRQIKGKLTVTHDSITATDAWYSYDGAGNINGTVIHTWQAATYSNFEELVLGKVISYDARGYTGSDGVKVTFRDATDTELRATVDGSAGGDTFVVDSDRNYTVALSAMQFLDEPITVRGHNGDDYIAGELVASAIYDGGSGLDTFQVLGPSDAIAGWSFSFSLDLEAQTGSATATFTANGVTQSHTETGISVTGFEWAGGSAYNDTLKALSTGSMLAGNGGNDLLVGRGGNDQLFGGTGNDTLEGGAGHDKLDGGAGNDRLIGGAGRNVLAGGAGDDTLIAGDEGDYLEGGEGQDSLLGGAGDDEIAGGAGNDTLLGGGGNDTLDGGEGDNRIEGGSGNSTVTAGSGNNTVVLTEGDNVVSLGWGANSVSDGGGASRISLGRGSVSAGDGNDTITGGTTVDAGAGDDEIAFQASVIPMSFAGGSGTDHVTVTGWSLSTYATVYVDLRYIQELDFTSGNFEEISTLRGTLNDVNRRADGTYYIRDDDFGTITGVEHFTFTDLNERIELFGDAHADHMGYITGRGISLDNWVDAGGGDDNVNAGWGDDTIIGGLGNDTIDGSDGVDVVDYSHLGSEYFISDAIRGDFGRYTVVVSNASGVVFTDTLYNVESVLDVGGSELDFNRGDDLLNDITIYNSTERLSGGFGNDTLNSKWGNDTLDGGAGDDVLNAQEYLRGDAVLIGGEGNDTLTAGGGNSWHRGGLGNDVIWDGGGQNTVEGGEGDDSIATGGGNDLIDGGTGNDTISAGAGNDTVDGGAGADVIDGWEGDDLIRGGAGADTLNGGDGGDTLDGGSEADLIDGGTGDDVLIGGAGDDTLTGGTGRDSFRFGTADGTTSITDLEWSETLVFVTPDASVTGNPLISQVNGVATVTFGSTTVTASLPGATVFTVVQVNDATGTTFTITAHEAGTRIMADTGYAYDGYSTTVDVLANDYAEPGVTLTLVGFDSATAKGGTVTLNPDGTLEYDTGSVFNRLGGGIYDTDTFTYQVSNGTETFTETVTVTIRGTNQTPTAVEDAVTLDEDTSLSIDVLANDIDPDSSDSLSITALTDAAHGSVAVVDGRITYTPDANWFGDDTFTYTMTDGNSTEQTATVNVTVAAVGDVPMAGDDTLHVRSSEAGQTLSIDVLANDINVDLDALAITGVTQGSYGSVAIVDGRVTYTAQDVTAGGSDSFTYTVTNAAGLSDTATVSVTLDPWLAPTVADDAITVTKFMGYGALVLDLLGNDTDPDGQSLTITAITQPDSGVVTLNADGSVSFDPVDDLVTQVSFSYTVTNQIGLSSTANVTVDVQGNNAPTAALSAIAGVEDTVLLLSVNAIARDVDGDLLRLLGVDAAGTEGTVVEMVDDQTLRLTPGANFNGSESFGFSVTDGLETVNLSFDVIWASVWDAPVPVNTVVYITPDSAGVTFNPLLDDIYIDDPRPASSSNTVYMLGHEISQPGNGSVVWPNYHSTTLDWYNGDPEASNSVTYTPNAGFRGVDSFTYTSVIRNDFALPYLLQTQTVYVVVDENLPVLVDDALSIVEDLSGSIDLLANDSDIDGDPLVLTHINGIAVSEGSVVDLGAAGRLTVGAGGTVTYQGGADFNGTTDVTYTVNNVFEATLALTATVGNDAPLALADLATTAEDTPVTLDVLANDSDPESDVLSVTDVGQGSNGSVVLNADGTVTYTPDANFFGTDSFTYTISDGAFTDTATATVTVTPVNDGITWAINRWGPNTEEGNSVSIDLSTLATDIDGDVLTFEKVREIWYVENDVAIPQLEQYSSIEGNLLTITAPSLWSGSFYTLVRATDGNGATSENWVSIAVYDYEDVPVAVDDVAEVLAGQSVDIDVIANDSDRDLSAEIIARLPFAIGVQSLTAPDMGSASKVVNPDGSSFIRFDANDPAFAALKPGETMQVSFTYVTRSDNTREKTWLDSYSNSATVTVTVVGIDDPLTATAGHFALGEGDAAATFTLDALDPDNALSFSFDLAGLRGTVVNNGDGSFSYDPGTAFESLKAGEQAVDTFLYTVTNGTETLTRTVDITVTGINDAPVTVEVSSQGEEDQPLLIDILGTASDIDGDALALVSLDGQALRPGQTVETAAGSFTLAPGGHLYLVPAANVSGSFSFAYGLSDGTVTVTNTLQVTLAPVNDPAVVSGDLVARMSEDDTGVSGQIHVADIDSPAALNAGTLTGQYGSLDLGADGQWSYIRSVALDYLAEGESLTERFALSTADGTAVVLEIEILGAVEHLDLVGTAADETLIGGPGNDTLTGLGGDDTLVGGEGSDLVRYLGASDGFEFRFAPDGSGLIVTDIDPLDGMDEGRDLIAVGTEALIFGDGVTGEIDWAPGRAPRLVLSLDGEIREVIVDRPSGLDVTRTFENGVLVGETVSDTGSAPWANLERLFTADGQVAQVAIVMDDGSTLLKENSFTDGVLTGQLQTDGSGATSGKAWSTRELSFDAEGHMVSMAMTFDDGTTRLHENTFSNGVRVATLITDGEGTAGSLPWSSRSMTFDADGHWTGLETVFDDGTTMQISRTYVDGQLARELQVDGIGNQSSKAWSTREFFYDGTGVMTQSIILRDDGDQVTQVFENGLLASRLIEDLDNDQAFTSRLITFAPDGSVLGSEVVWDVIG